MFSSISRLGVITALSSMVVFAAISASPTDRHRLLAQLHTQLEAIRAGTPTSSDGLPSTDLSALTGTYRAEILKALGAADACGPGAADACAEAKEWVYFFYREWDNSKAKIPEDVVVTADGSCCSLALQFSDRGVVDSAHWQR